MSPVSTRDRIMTAAMEVFAEKGLDGARMHEIAERANVNKAMIYYHYGSKIALFEMIFRETFSALLRAYENMPVSAFKSIETLVTRIVDIHVGFLAQRPKLPALLTREIHNPDPVVKKILDDLAGDFRKRIIEPVTGVLVRVSSEGRTRPVDPLHTLWNVFALNAFFFAAKPVLETFWKELFIDEDKLLEKRKETVTDLLLYGLLPR
jgi:TetR/AcrR family transcriptional regulator